MATTAEDMNFDETPAGNPITVMQHLNNNNRQSLEWIPNIGNGVELKLNGDSINARIIAVQNDCLVGEISAFDNQSVSSNGLSIHQRITFLRQHVWSAEVN